MCRGFFTSATAGGDDKAKEAQKTAGNPYAPTSSAGGTPTDNKDDEGHTPQLLQHHVWLNFGTHVVYYSLLLMHATGLIEISVNVEYMLNQDQCTLKSPQLHC